MTRVDQNIDIASYIDHALLMPTATTEQVEQCCVEAEHFQFPTVCVYPTAVPHAVQILHQKKVKVCAVIGFPSGATTTEVKAHEALEAVEQGARELDVVINLGWLKEGRSEKIYREMARICEESQQTVKAILETALLTDTEKRLAAEICLDAGVNYLKTSTGWFGGATVKDVKFLVEITKGQVGIKAAGGIKTLEQAIALIEAGATRLGTSRGIELVQQQKSNFSDIDNRYQDYE